MNTTMADGARERCVAQIGEALFCRPGMTLDEIANRCMGERDRSGFEPILHDSIFDACNADLNRLRAEMDQVAGCLPGAYYMDPPDGGNVSIPEQIRRMAEDAANHRKAIQLAGQIVAWHWPSTGAVCSAEAVERDRACTDNAVPLLAAQPSPAGQGDAPEIERIRTLVSSILSTVSLGHQRGPYAYAGEDFGRYLAEATRDCRTILRALSDLAARRPVAAAVKDSLTVGGGQAWVVADGQGARWRMWGSFGPEWTSDRDQALHFARRADAEAFASDDEDAWLIQPVGVLAQAVDLGQFRWAVQFCRGHHSHGSALNEQVIAESDRLLALIDSKAAAGEPNTAPDRLTVPAHPTLFYIQDTRQVVGNCPVWWGPNGGGYVTRLDEAGRYTEQEAVSQNRTRETDIPWPCAEIDALARKTVDCQHMRPRAERLAELIHMESKEVGR